MKLYAGEKRGAPKKPKDPKKKNHVLKRWGKSLFRGCCRFFLMLFIWGGIVTTMIVLWFSHDLPDLKHLKAGNRRPSVVIQTEYGYVLGRYGDLFETLIRFEDLPPYVPKALMAVEDRRFYQHFGVDIIGLVRAAYRNYKAGRVVQGGSTLTQQLSKNILFCHGSFSTNDRSMKRKIQEVLLSFWLEWHFKKDEILTLYLNRVYFGAGTYGIDAAARKYFRKSARNLTIFESALIAGLLQAPSRYSPAQNPDRAIKRAKVVLSLMKEAKFIGDYQNDLDQGIKEIKFYSLENTNEQSVRYFSNWIYEQIADLIDPHDQDLIVTTTLDRDLQKKAEDAFTAELNASGKEMKVSEGAFIVMNHEGAVRAMIGGRDYAKSQYNRATQALRQSGSAFKPIVYLAALEHGMTPETLIEDTPVVIGKWRPRNFKWTSRGQISLRTALCYSVNAVSVRLAQQVGAKKIAEVAERLGITHDMTRDLSIALGTGVTTLLELTTVYATFANHGQSVWAHGILEIRTKEGKVLYQRKPPRSRPLIRPDVLKNLEDMLRSAVVDGTGKAANVDDNIYGKTGSNGEIDAWFLAYCRGLDENLVMGIRVGNDDNKPMAKKSTGGRIPARIAGSFMKSVLGTKVSQPGKDSLPSQHSQKALGFFLNRSQ